MLVILRCGSFSTEPLKHKRFLYPYSLTFVRLNVKARTFEHCLVTGLGFTFIKLMFGRFYEESIHKELPIYTVAIRILHVINVNVSRTPCFCRFFVSPAPGSSDRLVFCLNLSVGIP